MSMTHTTIEAARDRAHWDTQHTPGPWRYNWPDIIGGGGIVAEVNTIHQRGVADARLIAAAPELLAACRMALDSIPESVACFNAANEAEATRPTVLESYLRAAIAKATGGGL